MTKQHDTTRRRIEGLTDGQGDNYRAPTLKCGTLIRGKMQETQYTQHTDARTAQNLDMEAA